MFCVHEAERLYEEKCKKHLPTSFSVCVCSCVLLSRGWLSPPTRIRPISVTVVKTL